MTVQEFYDWAKEHDKLNDDVFRLDVRTNQKTGNEYTTVTMPFRISVGDDPRLFRRVYPKPVEK